VGSARRYPVDRDPRRRWLGKIVVAGFRACPSNSGVWDQYRLEDVRNGEHEQDVSQMGCGTADDIPTDGTGLRAVESLGTFRQESCIGAVGFEKNHEPIQPGPGVPAISPRDDDGIDPVCVHARDLCVATNRSGLRTTSRFHGGDGNAAAGFSDDQ